MAQKVPKRAFALPFFGGVWHLRCQNSIFGSKWRFWPLLPVFLVVCDTRLDRTVDTIPDPEIFLGQTLTTPDFSEIGSRNFVKITIDDKNRQNPKLWPKICDVRTPNSKTSFHARDFTLPTRRAKSAEKFRASPPPREIFAKISHVRENRANFCGAGATLASATRALRATYKIAFTTSFLRKMVQ